MGSRRSLHVRSLWSSHLGCCLCLFALLIILKLQHYKWLVTLHWPLEREKRVTNLRTSDLSIDCFFSAMNDRDREADFVTFAELTHASVLDKDHEAIVDGD